MVQYLFRVRSIPVKTQKMYRFNIFQHEIVEFFFANKSFSFRKQKTISFKNFTI